jgi:hypothetical protein
MRYERAEVTPDVPPVCEDNGVWWYVLHPRTGTLGWLFEGSVLSNCCGEYVTRLMPFDEIVEPGGDPARYIMAHIQLGGDEAYQHYRGIRDNQPSYPDWDAVDRAIRMWDGGVVVVNIGAFERVDVPGLGWQVVFAGTQTSASGRHFILGPCDIGEGGGGLDICLYP